MQRAIEIAALAVAAVMLASTAQADDVDQQFLAVLRNMGLGYPSLTMRYPTRTRHVTTWPSILMTVGQRIILLRQQQFGPASTQSCSKTTRQ